MSRPDDVAAQPRDDSLAGETTHGDKIPASGPSSAFAVMASSERMDWPTPRDYFAALDAEFHFTIDACASTENTKLPRFWAEVDEGLMQSWEGERVFMNPPYGRQLPRWIHKAWNESGHADLIVALIPARVDTTYWHDYIFGHAEIRFLRGRLRFEGAENVAPFPVAVVIWRNASTSRSARHLGARTSERTAPSMAGSARTSK